VPERYLGTTLGKFRIDALIGTGGFAWVYKGWDPELEIPVALKVLKPQYAGDEVFEERFRREASTAARLRHPNIVKIYAVGRDGGAVYFAMDYLPQGLADRLEVMPYLPEEVLVRLGMDVASALGFAHREGVIHRDVKIDNILFDAHGNAVVADFGIARAILNYAAQTGTNMVVGTPQYFSPEQARGLPLDGRADIYSLGVTLFRAAAGVLPFNGEDWYEIARQHVEDRPPSVRAFNPALSRDLERIILRCLAKSPEGRFATGEDLCEALAALARQHGTGSAARTLVFRRRTPTGTHTAAEGPASSAGIRSRRAVAMAPAVVLGAGVAALAVAVGARYLRDDAPGGRPTDSAAGAIALRPQPTLPPARLTPAESALMTMPADTTELFAAPGVLTVRAPAEATLRVNGRRVGQGTWRSDTMPPDDYTVTATVPSVQPCPTATVVARVTLEESEVRSVPLTPQPCAPLTLDIRPREASASYVLQGPNGISLRGKTPRDTALVLPVGRYSIRVEAPYCAPFSDTLVVPVGTRARRERILLICESLTPPS
jgi:eukaryotic-like serine/threonine-protein kinase